MEPEGRCSQRDVVLPKKLKEKKKQKEKALRLTEKCANIFFRGDSLIGNFKNVYQPRNTAREGGRVGFTWETNSCAVWTDQKPSMLTTVVQSISVKSYISPTY